MGAGWIKSTSKFVSALAMLGGASLLVPSCADNGVSLFIRGVIAIKAPDCIAKPDADATLWPSLYFDSAITTQVEVPLLIGSQLFGRGDPKTSRGEPNRIQLSGAEVELTDTGGAAIVPKFTVPTLGVVDPTASSDASYGVAYVTLIPSGVAAAVVAKTGATNYATRKLILANVKVFGKTLGGTDVESLPVAIQIYACFGCSVIFPSDAADAAVGSPNCLKASTQSKTCLKGVEQTSCQDCNAVACFNCFEDAGCPAGLVCDIPVGRCRLK
ncbi:MAG: hypothetical protein JNL79_19075 [Myxococcales bacterium]|nr:hypothetical protein [Myxococcales bacterium]